MKIVCYPLLFILFLSCNTDAQTVDPSAFEKGLTNDVQLLDVRTPEEYEAGHITNAMRANIRDKAEFERGVASLDKTKPVYVYCRSGARSSTAADMMRKKGFKEVIALDGGIDAWRDANKEVEVVAGTPPMSPAEYERMLADKGLVLAYFGASWSPPSRKMAPVISELEKEFTGKMSVVKIDGGEQAGLMEHNSIKEMPGFILYKNGKEVWRATGVLDKESIMKTIQKHM